MEETAVLEDFHNNNDIEEEREKSGNSPAFPAINLMASREETKTLSKKEEQKLMARIKNAEAKWDAFKKAGAPNQLINQAENEYIELINEFMTHNLKLVASITIATIRKYGLYGETDDLFSAGCEGLRKAVEKFDPGYGCKFSTYATSWIMSYMQRYIQNEIKVVRLPVHFQEESNRLKAKINNFEKKYGRAPTLKETAKITKKNQKRIIRIMNDEIQTVGINDPIGNNDLEYADIISSPSETPEKIVERMEEVGEIVKIFEQIFKKMPPQKTYVLKKRIGYMTNQEFLESIAKQINRTRERVRQIEIEALKIFRQKAEELVAEKKITKNPIISYITQKRDGEFLVEPSELIKILRAVCLNIDFAAETYQATMI